ncbi:MAG: ATP-binding protein [Enterococcus sp.]|nr:ATP-binding protein [Enterococcus sp.]
MRLKTEKHNIISNIEDTPDDKAMRLDPKSFGKLIGSLTKIYPNEHLAVMREYAANAYDAHVVAGQTRPIEITLPSARHPYLLIQDWGTGMSYREMDEILGMYGKSTKEETDLEFGFFGLGSKSALNICDSFTFTSVKDGEKSVLLIYRGENGLGRTRKISVTRSDEPNGTIVSIPATGFDEFREAALRIFPTWKRGTVLVNGETPEYIDDKPNYYKVGDMGYVETTVDTSYTSSIKNSKKTNLKVIMGGISYRVGELSEAQIATVFGSEKAIPISLRSQEILVRFDNLSDLPILPNREEIAINPESLAAISRNVQKMLLAFIAEVKAKVNNASNIVEAIKLRSKYIFAAGKNSFTWDGAAIPGEITEPNLEVWIFNSRTKRKTKGHLYNSMIRIEIGYRLLALNMHGINISSDTALKHLKVWANAKGVRLGTVGLFSNPEGKLGSRIAQSMAEAGNIRIVSGTEVVEFSKEYTKRQRAITNANRNHSNARLTNTTSVEYPSFYMSANRVVRTTLSAGEIGELDKKTYYFQQQKRGVGMVSDISNLEHLTSKTTRALSYLGEDSLIVFVSPERKANALVNRLGEDVEIYDGMKALHNAIFTAAVEDTSTVAEQIVNSLKRARGADMFSLLDNDKVKSSVIRDAARLSKGDGIKTAKIHTLMEDARKLLNIAETSYNSYRTDKAKELGVEGKAVGGYSVMNRFYTHYPLLGSISSGLSYYLYNKQERFVEDLIDYVNTTTELRGEFTIQ